MNARHVHVASCALLTLIIATLAGCTDAGKCARGSVGCLPRPERHELGRCDPGLSYEDGICADSGGDGDGPREPGPPPDVDCEGATEAAICASFCELFCYNQILFCGRSECTPADCAEGGEVLGLCLSCSNTGCATQLCQNQTPEKITCNDFGVEVIEDGVRRYETMCLDQDPLCVQHPELGCSNVCGSDEGVNGDYVRNGICEDGHESSLSSVCDRGTDCIDCEPHPCLAAGVECTNHGDCCGFYGDGALCVDPDGPTDPKPPVCNPVCDKDVPDACPTGFECQKTSIDTWVCAVPQQ